MLAFQGPGNGLETGLLPAATGFAVLEDFVPADDPGVVHVKLASFTGGPKHEGRVAVASPGDGDGAGGRLIFDEAMLRKDGGGVGFGDVARHEANDAIGIVQKLGGRSGNELRVVNRGVGQAWLWRRLSGEGSAEYQGERSGRKDEEIFRACHEPAFLALKCGAI